MQRYAFQIQYLGKNYFGWQRQIGQISVQEKIEKTIQKLYNQENIDIVGCGRTDAGVHAHQYFLHVDLPEIADPKQFIFKLNRILPDSISIHAIEEVECDLHARFNAKARTYRYFIHQKKNAFLNEFSWYHPVKLDYQKMNDVANDKNRHSPVNKTKRIGNSQAGERNFYAGVVEKKDIGDTENQARQRQRND
jgi:tRNA pseudouridine38-40 synthase